MYIHAVDAGAEDAVVPVFYDDFQSGYCPLQGCTEVFSADVCGFYGIDHVEYRIVSGILTHPEHAEGLPGHVLTDDVGGVAYGGIGVNGCFVLGCSPVYHVVGAGGE